jgi:hypothetical protein
MKEFLILTAAVLVFVGLVILQLKFLKKHHPNAELLIGMFKILKVDKKTQGNDSNDR